MRSVDVRTKVEQAALKLFAANGVDGVSIAEIAGAAGVSQGALYRHYSGKAELAWALFSAAYLRTGAELDAIRERHSGFAARIEAMVAHMCALYDRDSALFRFMLMSQHDYLPRVAAGSRTPVSAIEDSVAEAVTAGELPPVEVPAAAAAILGVIVQTAVFDAYGRLAGPLSARADRLAAAVLAAVAVLAGPAESGAERLSAVAGPRGSRGRGTSRSRSTARNTS